MFQKAELTRLQTEKELLVMQSRINRVRLSAEWQQVCSPEVWRQEAGRLVRRRPMLIAALAAAGGVFALRAIRQPKAPASGGGKLARMASLAFTVWKLVRSRKQ